MRTTREQIEAILQEFNDNPDEDRYGEDTVMFFGDDEDRPRGLTKVLDTLVEFVEWNQGRVKLDIKDAG